jgi:hypothetical protein
MLRHIIKIQQLLLDTVAHLLELKTLRVVIRDGPARVVGLGNFKPTQGLRYVDELIIDSTRYMWREMGNSQKGIGKYDEVFG